MHHSNSLREVDVTDAKQAAGHDPMTPKPEECSGCKALRAQLADCAKERDEARAAAQEHGSELVATVPALKARISALEEALREVLAEVVTKSNGVADGPIAHEPYAMCTICGNEDDPDEPFSHDPAAVCGKAHAAVFGGARAEGPTPKEGT